MDEQTRTQKRYFQTERLGVRWQQREISLSHWLQGWTILVAGVFLSKIWLEMLPWWAVAAFAGSHTAMYVLLITVNGHRWQLEYRRRELEKRFSGGE